MKVIIIPQGTNPYTRLLADALVECEINAILAPMYKLRLLWYAVWQNGKPDVIHLQWQHHFFIGPSWLYTIISTIIFFIQIFSLRLIGIKFVWTVHNVVHHERDKEKWELLACRLLSKTVDQIIVHCQSAKQEISQAYKVKAKKITVIPHGTFAPLFTDFPVLSKKVAKDKLGLSAEQIVFLNFGLIRPYKGVDDLIEAFYQLQAPQARLVIVGKTKTDNLLTKISTLAAEDNRILTRLEFVSDKELSVYICAADFVVLPYKNSLTSGVVSPTAVYSRPVIAPKLGCFCDLPQDGALLYLPQQEDGLLHSLQKAMTAPSEVMGQVMHQYDAQFCWSHIATRTAQLYQQVC